MSSVNFQAPTDYNNEQADIERRRKYAELLSQQSLQPSETQMAGGWAIPTSWTQHAAKLFQAYSGKKGQEQATAESKALAGKYQTDVSGDTQRLIEALRGRQAQTVQPDPQEGQQSADYGTPQVPPVNIPAMNPTDALQSALPNMRTPMGQQLGQAYLLSNLKNDEKFGHTPVTMKQPDGQLVQVLVGDKGTLKPVSGYGVAQKLHFADTGSGIQPLGEYSGTPQGGPIAKSMTPDAQANLDFRKMEFSNLSKAQQIQLGQEAERIGISRQQLAEGRVQLVQDADGGVHIINKISGVGSKATDENGTSLNIPKPLTETQGKANLFGTRAQQADQILKETEGKISTTGLAAKRGAENIPLVGGVAGAVGNTMLTQDQQKVEQAQRNFVNAVLRVESGAAISESEFKNAVKQYFPQPGDGPQVIAQKRQNRATAIQGLQTMAGRGTPQSSVITNPAAAADPLGLRGGG